MSNDARRHQLTEVLALVQEQMADIAAIQRRQSELTVSATAADGLVEVTVNAHGHVIGTAIEESYLEEFDFDELAGFVTEAAQSAAHSAARQVAEMMAPLTDRRRSLPSLSDIVEGAPDLRDLAPPPLEPITAQVGQSEPDDGGQDSALPTVRR